MIDLLMLVEMAWCTVLIGSRAAEKALVYSGGILASGYVSSQIAPWIEKTFVSPSSTTFLWLQDNIVGNVQMVLSRAANIPPEPASTGGLIHSQWIAYHIVSVLLFVFITGGIFTAFAVVCYLRDAIWGQIRTTRPRRLLSYTLGAICGVYVVIITGITIANLSWIHQFEELSQAATASIGIRVIGSLTNLVPWI